MSENGSCSLIIKGMEIDFDDISRSLEFEPTKIVKKGDVVSKVIGTSEIDIWVYELKFTQHSDINIILRELISILVTRKQYIKKICSIYDVSIKCYLQSTMAQISFYILPEITYALANFNIQLYFSVFSWGGVED